MTKSRLYAHIILDRSGSMASSWDTTVEAVNGYMKELAGDKEVKGRVSLTVFDSGSIDTIRTFEKVGDCKSLSVEEVQPRGSTPLLDAIGHAVGLAEKQEMKKNTKVAFVIVTDGYENASKEHTRDSIKNMLDSKREKDNWLVLYLGADHDSFAQSGSIGISKDYAMNICKENADVALSSAYVNTSAYASTGNLRSAAFSSDQRKAAMASKLNEKKKGDQWLEKS